ncbi:MAG: pyruvate formate lyase family protein [Thomasclavelia spiroformis]
MARVCKKVPYEKAETFYGNSVTWFIQLILQIESNGHSLSMDVLINTFVLIINI